jgi:hypothetical protein
MKKYLILLLALTLAGCSALAPVAPQPTPIPPTAQVVLQTVVVMITPTPLPPTPVPPPTLAPTNTLPPPTEAPPAAPTATLPPPGSAGTGAPISIPNTDGGGVFINIGVSGDYFSLRCYPKELTFTVTATDTHIVSVTFYYRIVDMNSADISDWINGGLMRSDRQGNYSLTLSAEGINPDWRRKQTSYDFEFVGTNSLGDVVGRSSKIVNMIRYTNDCP